MNNYSEIDIINGNNYNHLTAYQLLNEISQYNIGNTDHIFDSKELRSRLNKLDFNQITDFLSSCDTLILRHLDLIKESNKDGFTVKPNDDWNNNIKNIQIFYKIAKKIGSKKMKDIF